MKFTILPSLFAITFVTIFHANAWAQAPVPDGSASRISDWALAGVIWSDASLTKKLADQAAKEADSPERAEQFRELSRQSSRMIEAMESFGWKQVNSTANASDKRAVQNKGSRKALPNSRKLGSTLDESFKRFDTETPAGWDDPGIDDERTGEGLSLNLHSYRVDDYIDETPAEARNLADALEDGVEGAIAAASGRLGTGLGTAGHISERETQTRSAKRPYSQDSIYDSDDYDPDIDYNVDNPLVTRSTNPESIGRGDGDDDIDLRNPAKVIDGEDELLAAMAREQKGSRTPDISPAEKRRVAPRTNVDRYTAERSKHGQDANWVQFHLDANQAVWNNFTTQENLSRRTSDALMRLKADVSVAIEATDNERLISILRQVR